MVIDVDTPRQTSTPPPIPPRRGMVIAMAALVGLIVGSAGTWWVVHPRPSDWFPVQVLEGNAFFNSHHTAFGLTFKDGSGFFSEVGNADGRECIPEPDPTTADIILMNVRIGVVRASPAGEEGGRQIVVWIRCLGPATRSFGS